MKNNYLFLLTTFMFFIVSSFAHSNDYMSTELKKAIDIECKQSVKDNLFNTKAECENSLIESLNKVGIVSVTRVNDEEIQDDIEGICVFAKNFNSSRMNLIPFPCAQFTFIIYFLKQSGYSLYIFFKNPNRIVFLPVPGPP